MTTDKEFEAWAKTKYDVNDFGQILIGGDEGEWDVSAQDCSMEMLDAWQAARAIDAKRIAELEAWANRPVTDNTQLIANMEAQITDLEAEVARLTAIIEDMKVVDNVFSK